MARREGGFPSVLYFGGHAGEGQSGGRYIVEEVHKAEAQMVQKYGREGYIRRMARLMGKRK